MIHWKYERRDILRTSLTQNDVRLKRNGGGEDEKQICLNRYSGTPGHQRKVSYLFSGLGKPPRNGSAPVNTALDQETSKFWVWAEQAKEL